MKRSRVPVLERVDDGAQRVPDLDRLGTVLPVHVGDEIADQQKLAQSPRGRDDQEPVVRNLSAGEVDLSVYEPARSVDAHQPVAVEPRAGKACDLGENVSGVGALRVVEHLVDQRHGEARNGEPE